MSQTKRQLIETQAVSEFGDLTESAAFHDPTIMDRDATYVPGYSEGQRLVSTKLAEFQQGKIAKGDIPFQSVRLRWARSQNRSGTPDTMKTHAHGQKGYRLVNKEHVGQSWLKDLPPGCEVLPDGSIRRGDTVLMYCSREDAAKSELAKRVATEERLTGTESTFLQNLQSIQGAPKDAAPTVVKLGKDEPVFGKKK